MSASCASISAGSSSRDSAPPSGRGNLAQVDDAGVEHEPFFQRPQQCLHEHTGARGLVDTAIDGDDFEGGSHWWFSVWIDPYLSAVAADGANEGNRVWIDEVPIRTTGTIAPLYSSSHELAHVFRLVRRHEFRDPRLVLVLRAHHR